MEKQATFAERLKEALELRGMTKADLSRLTGISKSSLTHYERETGKENNPADRFQISGVVSYTIDSV